MLAWSELVLPEKDFLVLLQRDKEVELWIFHLSPVRLRLVGYGGTVKIGIICAVEMIAEAIHDRLHAESHPVTDHTVKRGHLAFQTADRDRFCHGPLQVLTRAITFDLNHAERVI